MTDQEWVAVAIITRPHALGGAVMLKPLTRTVEEFLEAPLEKFQVRRRGRILRTLTVSRITIHKGMPCVFFEEIPDRNAAEEIAGSELVIPEEELWELPEGEYYAHELEGVEVVEQGSRRHLGTVTRAQEGSAHDFLIFPHPDNPEKEVMLPFIDEFVLSVDLETNRAEVRLPEGLLDL